MTATPDKRAWWEFTRFDIVFVPLSLLSWYAILEPPAGWRWLLLPPSLLLGKALGAVVFRRWR